MTTLTDPPATRRLQAAALVAAPLAGLATTMVWPDTPIDTRDRLAVLADAVARTQAAHALNLLTILLFLPAIAGMYRLLAPRRPRSAVVGGGLVAAGLIGWSGVLALSSAELQIARGADRQAAVAAAESLPGSPVAVAMTAMFLLCTFGGLVVLTVALWRARTVPGWVPVAVGVAVVGDVVASTVTVVVLAVWVLLTLAFTAIARVRIADPAQPRDRTSVSA